MKLNSLSKYKGLYLRPVTNNIETLQQKIKYIYLWTNQFKNDMDCFEQILEATLHKTTADGHLPPISQTVQVRRTRFAELCWRSKDELKSDLLL